MKPCPDCPFSRNVTPGALGGSSPTVYLGQAIGPYVIPCHKHIKYEHDNWREKCFDTPSCIGAAIYRSNINMATQLPDKLLRVPANHELVFSNGTEFLAHHGRCTIEEASQFLLCYPDTYWLEQQLARSSNLVR